VHPRAKYPFSDGPYLIHDYSDAGYPQCQVKK
jgi:hypothetical protein